MMSRTRVGLLVLASCTLIAGCGSSDDSRPPESWGDVLQAINAAESTTVQSGGSSPSATAPPAASAAQSPVLTFNPAMVRAQGVTKEAKGGQSNVRFVAGSRDAKQIGQLALDCVRHFTKQTEAAYCYAYGTEADYAVKTPDWTPEFDETIYGGSRPCWVAQGGQSLNDHEPALMVESHKVLYDSSDCPGGVRF
ncbi:hypothetical protein QSJ19_03125 [Gordonia sp. ABSL11-1]|uniref:hypothetical protein n=1 Tax=Gordonia sp. ABSL11-1 TaxID=3053924 RepID=UPI002573852F|nr:hypothetical protein [Gordonia sp. ABSL11-1]MDL9944592.1 hypothetical protein [Gordonia sp. ABSL11-1]